MMENNRAFVTENEIEDISEKKTGFFLVLIVLLFLSFFNPLWFVF